MKTTRRSLNEVRSERGLALVMTVLVLALVTIMVLGFADLVRNESATSSSHMDRARAQSMAELAVEMVEGTLLAHTGDPNMVWASQPGSLLVPVEGATQSLGREVPLHSGVPSTARPTEDGQEPEDNRPDYFAAANLNKAMISEGNTHLITEQRGVSVDGGEDDVVALPLRWLYLRRDGTMVTDEQPDLGVVDNPLVGRLAWWTDDESSKINLNTAWKRNSDTDGTSKKNPFGANHVTNLSLPHLIEGMDFGLFGVNAEVADKIEKRKYEMADKIHETVTPSGDYVDVFRFFNSTAEVNGLRDAGAGLEPEHFKAFHDAAKFQLTHYNHDPDTTYFNEQRIVLTTNKDRARGLPFLDIAKVDSNTNLWHPINHIDPTKLAKTIKMLNEYIARTDSPLLPNTSFQEKYFAGKADRLTQLSLNIINYVRSKEAKGSLDAGMEGVVIPVRGEHVPGKDFVLMDVATSVNSYIGITRAPRITEMAVWVDEFAKKDADGLVPAEFRLEVYLPMNFGLKEVDMSKCSTFFSMTGSGVKGPVKKDGTGAIVNDYEVANTNANTRVLWINPFNKMEIPQPILKAGQRVIISRKSWVQVTGGRPSTVSLRYAISRSLRWDVTPLGAAAPATLDPEGTPLSAVTSIEVDDPRVNSHRDDWKRRQSGNSFGKPNDGVGIDGKKIATLGEATSTMPEQDTDENGKITDYSLYMPAPAGDVGNMNGVVESVGELGFIHTGMESGAGAGIPWRTLRLQPGGQTEGMLPDWAFMDLFTVPVDLPATASPRAKFMMGPHGGTAGRINLNAQAQPFGNAQHVRTMLERRLPLVALMAGIPYSESGNPHDLKPVIDTSRAIGIAGNIYGRVLADRGKLYGYESAFDSPGEVIEIKGVADWGEASEEVVRGLGNLVSIRGGVFTVYAIGQTLAETRSGNGLTVTGEYRQRTMLERYTDPAEPGVVKVRRLSFQPITP